MTGAALSAYSSLRLRMSRGAGFVFGASLFTKLYVAMHVIEFSVVCLCTYMCYCIFIPMLIDFALGSSCQNKLNLNIKDCQNFVFPPYQVNPA